MLRNISKVDEVKDFDELDEADELDEVDNMNGTINVNSISGKVKVFNSFYIDDTVAEALVVIAVVAIVIIGILVVYILKNKGKLQGGYRLGNFCKEEKREKDVNKKEIPHIDKPNPSLDSFISSIQPKRVDNICKMAVTHAIHENDEYTKNL